MSDFNKVFLVGRLTRDPELRFTPGGQAVCNLGLAVGREWKDKEGQKQKETTFLRIVVWGKTGESCAEYLKKGRQVLIEGRLQSRSWEGTDGKKNSALDVVADNVQFLGGREQGGGQDRDRGPAVEGDVVADNVQFLGGREQGGGQDRDRGPAVEGGAEDDIPF